MKIRPQLLGIETITGFSRGKRSYIKTANCFFAEWSLHFLAEFSFFFILRYVNIAAKRFKTYF